MGPRLFGIQAAGADVVAVIRRGPSDWCAVGRWDVVAGTYEAGAWLHGRIYPERSDLSPDGRWLCYFALHPSASWELGWTYVAISRLPWLYALAAWATDGTWTRGAHFVTDASVREVSEPDHGSLPYEALGAGLVVTAAASYAVERRRGWSEAPGTPPRDPGDLWDEQRGVSLRMTKPRPGDDTVRLEAGAGYEIVDGAGVYALAGVQWADWAHDGRLLVATEAGRLEMRNAPSWLGPEAVVADLADEEPSPREAPPEARSWT